MRITEALPPALSIVAPCYNEEAALAVLHERCSAAAQACVGEVFELVLVDDGSTDATRTRIVALADADHRTRGVFLSRNHGHQKALSAGLAMARGDRILIIDADLQDPPELLSQMMEMMDEARM